MHYPIQAELVSNPKDVVGWNIKLSDDDKRVIAFLYPNSTDTVLPQLSK